MENKSSILLSIFKRKGGEGLLTKIITDDNRVNYLSQLASLEEDENALLSFKEDDLNWLLLTNKRVLKEIAGLKSSIYFSDLWDVSIAIQEEFKDGVVNKSDFTRLILKDDKGNKSLLKLEKGGPFQGLYQVLHHIATITTLQNSSNHFG